jgi:hypothetical protein
MASSTIIFTKTQEDAYGSALEIGVVSVIKVAIASTFGLTFMYEKNEPFFGA